ncbi:MAG: hypothetical protein LQ338_005047 [Usnochroma carphineum]|nr:MAG: hypothetical protein LQ338_005047 [Usnochroma carphineum]
MASRYPKAVSTSIRSIGRRPRLHNHQWTRLRNMRWSSVSQRPGSDHVHFPGAVDSKFTAKLSFEQPSTHPAIPTYRFMDSDGVVVDKAREPDVSEDEVLTWYKDMLTGMRLSSTKETSKH